LAKLLIILTLYIVQGLAYLIPEKIEVLKVRFYPTTEADLSNIYNILFQDSFFQDSLEVPKLAISEEVSSLLRARKLYKALGNNRIPNGFLRAIGPKLAEAVVRLANIYWALGHFPARFKKA